MYMRYHSFSAPWMALPESWKRRVADLYAHDCIGPDSMVSIVSLLSNKPCYLFYLAFFLDIIMLDQTFTPGLVAPLHNFVKKAKKVDKPHLVFKVMYHGSIGLAF